MTAWWDMPDLSLNEKKELLSLARRAIETYLFKKQMLGESEISQAFSVKRACFVTLMSKGLLRGCIGSFDAEQTLFYNVTRMSVAAAFNDPRFMPVRESELSEIQIEISILGELTKMNSIEELILGKHGIKVHYQGHSGTYLPDVATQQNWSREEFIENCVKEKAGVVPEKLEDVDVYLYPVQKFSDDSM